MNRDNRLWTGARTAIVAALVTVVAGTALAAPVRLENVRHSVLGSYTRIALDFDGPVRLNRHEDWAGHQIVFHIPEARISPTLRQGLYTIESNHVASIRVQQLPGAGLKIIVKTPGEFQLDPVPLRGGSSRVFDLRGTESVSPEVHYHRAVKYESRGEYDKALQELRTAIRKRPGYPDAYFRAGVIRLLKGDNRRAMINFQQVPQSSPLGQKTQRYILAASEMPASNRETTAEPATGTSESRAHTGEAENDRSAMPVAQAEASASNETGGPDVPAQEAATFPAPAVPDLVEAPITAEEPPVDQMLHHERVLAEVAAKAHGDSQDAGQDDTAVESIPQAPQGALAVTPDTPVDSPSNGAGSRFFRSGETFIDLDTVLQYWYVFALATLLILAMGFLLARRLFRPRQTAPAERPLKPGDRVYDKALRKEVATGRMRVSSAPANAFAKRLEHTYRMTDATTRPTAIKPPAEKPRELVQRQLRTHRQQAIDSALKELHRPAPAPARKRKPAGSFVPKEKYLAVYRFHEQGWPMDRIARHLDLEREEVALALEMAPREPSGEGSGRRLARKLHTMRKQGQDTSSLARAMGMGTGELELVEELQGEQQRPAHVRRGGRRR